MAMLFKLVIYKIFHLSFQKHHDRDDFRELLELLYIFLGGTPSNRIKFKVAGANHHARWLSKTIYCLKIYMFKEQFPLKLLELKGLKQICLFAINFYVITWFDAPSAIKALY